MEKRTKLIAAGAAAVVVIAGGAFLLSGNKSDIPLIGDIISTPTCPLTGVEQEDEKVLAEPAVAIKIENNSVAYPLSGLEDADLVYEEVVEGGLTRFMAIYHCGSTDKAGPVRSSRQVDPAIMSPITRILAAAGGNDAVRGFLEEAKIVLIDESDAGEAMERVERPGITSEHTLYADVQGIRKIGKKTYAETPQDGIFEFGDAAGESKPAGEVTIMFSPANIARFEWGKGGYLRFQGETPLEAESGGQIKVDNVLIEEHTINFSDIVDVTGTQSIEIADVTGTGKAMLFRDGKAYKGSWTREAIEDPVSFQTETGEDMVLKAGTTWVELVPNKKGEVKGSVSFNK